MTKGEFSLNRINELVNLILGREVLTDDSKADLGYIKFYAKELVQCKDCANETAQSERLKKRNKNSQKEIK